MRRFVTPSRLLLLGGLLLALAAVLYVAPSDRYIFLPDEARAVAPLVAVKGEQPDRDGGGIYYVAVDVRKASILEKVAPGIREGATLVKVSEVRSPGENEQQHREAELASMRQSQRYAAAVALRYLGYPIEVFPKGGLIQSVLRGFPAQGKLRRGDLVVAVDNVSVQTPDHFRNQLRRRRPGETVRLQVLHAGRPRIVRLRTARNPEAPSRPFLGVLIQEAQVTLPLTVEIDTGEVGGPSAGLAFALDLAEELGRSVDRGHRIAATGELRLDGSVGPVGGIKQKTIGARRSGVDVFLVPGENAKEARRHAGDLRIIAVKSFRQALRALATLPPKRDRS